MEFSNDRGELLFKYSNKRPIAVSDLTASLNGFADEYRRAIVRYGSKIEDGKSRLYIKEIRSGSVIATLVPLIPVLHGLIDHNFHIVDFSQQLHSTIKYFQGLGKPPAFEIERRNCENIRALVEPITKEDGAEFIFEGPSARGLKEMTRVTTVGAAVVKQNIAKEMDLLQEPSINLLKNMKIHWYQARNDRFSTAGDRGIIDAISEKPVKVIFSTENLKNQMLLRFGNPFQMLYDVDVVADFRGKKPRSYQIIALNSATPLDGS